MSNGYKPAPLELSDVKLTAGQEVLVDKLAENAHNVWAKDRIKQGWTYGIQQVTPHFYVGLKKCLKAGCVVPKMDCFAAVVPGFEEQT